MRSPSKIDDLRDLVSRYTIASVAWLAGVSEGTVEGFRKGRSPKPATLKKIKDAVGRLRNGLSIATAPGPLHVDSGKPWEGKTTVKAIAKDKACGWCGKRHEERFKC